MGTRAVFLRTHACNLLCGGGKYTQAAKWTCDTIPVFSKIQKRYEPSELLADWDERGWVKELRAGAHLVLTGGEPLMPERQQELIPFLKLLNGVFTEVETNGTFIPQPELHRHITHYNVSPKLATSGMPRDMRISPDVLHWHCRNPSSIFKFVISTESDMTELSEDFINPFQIPAQRIWLMPAASTRDALLQYQPIVANHAQKNGYNFSTRLHILLYDQVTGV